jgi:hypothetical protein
MKKEQQISEVDESRRRFLEKTGKAAVIAPAAALLLAAESKTAMAQTPSGGTPPVT